MKLAMLLLALSGLFTVAVRLMLGWPWFYSAIVGGYTGLMILILAVFIGQVQHNHRGDL